MNPLRDGRNPIFPSLAGYRLSWLKPDISAGLAIAAVGLPSAIAYPAIAGLPAQTGLYASITPLIAYALLGPSRQLIVGPDAATMTVLAAVLAAAVAAAPPDAPIDPVAAAGALALTVGGFYFVARLLRLDVLANFLSRPILIGFFAGISLSILVGQIGRFTGVPIEADGLIPPLLELARKADLIHWPSLALALAMFGVLQATRALRLAVPGPVIVVVLAVILSAALDLESRGVAVVGAIPETMPRLTFPSFAGLSIDTLTLGAASVFLVGFSSGIVTARSFGASGGYDVNPNRELTGFGAANIAAGVFGAFPVTASDSRTAINATIGGRSQIAAVTAAAVLLATILYFGEALRILPIPALGAILVAAALSLIDLDALRNVWRVSRIEFAFAMIALVGPLSLGVLNGIVIAVGATLVYLLSKMMHPRDAMLGRIPGRDGFYKLHRTPTAQAVPGLAICLLQGDLLFFNADALKARLRAIASDEAPDTRWFVIDASAVAQTDSTGAAALGELAEELAARGLTLGLAELHSEVHAILDRAGVIGRIGHEMVFDDLDDALRAFRATEHL